MTHLHDAQTETQNPNMPETQPAAKTPGAVRQLGQKALDLFYSGRIRGGVSTPRGLDSTARYVQDRYPVGVDAIPGTVPTGPAEPSEGAPNEVSEPPTKSAA